MPQAKFYVYDNNSTDDTFSIAESAGAIVCREYKQGKGNVIRSMFRDIDADCYILVDGDDTYPPESAMELCSPILEGKCDMVVGDRLSTTYYTENKRPMHNAGNSLVCRTINFFWGTEKYRVNDVLSGYRAFSRLFVKSFPVISSGFEIETEMTIHALDKQFLVGNVPVAYRDRPVGSESKLNTVSDGCRVLFTIFNLYRIYKPLLFFCGIAFLFMLLGSILFGPIVFEYLDTGLVPRFPTMILSMFFYLSSLLCFCCGFILDAISYNNKKMFELYLINLKQGNSY